MYTMKHRKRAIASGLNVKQDSLTMPSGGSEGGLKVVQVPGSNDFTGEFTIFFVKFRAVSDFSPFVTYTRISFFYLEFRYLVV